MTITTIITTYKRPFLLKRAIESVLCQSYKNFQVYIYDNASHDETEEIISSFLIRDKRVKYHCHDKNIGMLANYQYAFDRIDSPFFSFLSDDDYLLPHFYETALQKIEKHPEVAFSACGIIQINEKGNLIENSLSQWKEGYVPAGQGILNMLREHGRFPVPTGIVFNRQVLRNIKPVFSEEMDFFWDPDYLMRIAAKHPIYITKTLCGVYLIGSQSYAFAFSAKVIEEDSALSKYLRVMWNVKQSIVHTSYPSDDFKRSAIQSFDTYFSRDLLSFCAATFKKYGFFFTFRFLKNYSTLSYFPFSFKCKVIIFKVFYLLVKKTLSSIMQCFKKILRISKIDASLLDEELKKHYQYGQKLLQLGEK